MSDCSKQVTKETICALFEVAIGRSFDELSVNILMPASNLSFFYLLFGNFHLSLKAPN